MDPEAVLPIVIGLAVSVALVWLGVSFKAEMHGLRAKLDRLETTGAAPEPAAAKANPRLAAAREAAAKRTARRPGRTTVKRI